MSSDHELQMPVAGHTGNERELFDFNSTDNRITTNEMILNDTYIVHDG